MHDNKHQRLCGSRVSTVPYLADGDVTLLSALRPVPSLQHQLLARARPELRVHLTGVVEDETFLPLGSLGCPTRLGAHLPANHIDRSMGSTNHIASHGAKQ